MRKPDLERQDILVSILIRKCLHDNNVRSFITDNIEGRKNTLGFCSWITKFLTWSVPERQEIMEP